MSSYIEAERSVNAQVDPVEIELPRFLPPRRKQAATAKRRRRRVSPEMWSTLRAAQAREHQSLPAGSPRLKPTLPKLRLREPA